MGKHAVTACAVSRRAVLQLIGGSAALAVGLRGGAADAWAGAQPARVWRSGAPAARRSPPSYPAGPENA